MYLFKFFFFVTCTGTYKMTKIRIINRDNTSTPMKMTSDVGTGDTSTTSAPMITTDIMTEDTIPPGFTTPAVEIMKQLQQDQSFWIYIVVIICLVFIIITLVWCFRKKIRVCWDQVI